MKSAHMGCGNTNAYALRYDYQFQSTEFKLKFLNIGAGKQLYRLR